MEIQQGCHTGAAGRSSRVGAQCVLPLDSHLPSCRGDKVPLPSQPRGSATKSPSFHRGHASPLQQKHQLSAEPCCREPWQGIKKKNHIYFFPVHLFFQPLVQRCPVGAACPRLHPCPHPLQCGGAAAVPRHHPGRVSAVFLHYSALSLSPDIYSSGMSVLQYLAGS